MNRYPLNARTLGAGITVPNKYWQATQHIMVMDTMAEFGTLRGVFLESNIQIAVSATTNFLRTAHIAADMVAQISSSFSSARMQHLVSDVHLTVANTFNASVGLLKLLASAVTFGVQGSVNTTVEAFMAAEQVIQETASAVFGVVQRMLSSQQVRVDITANLTAFGEYAPDERYIIVDSEDRDTEVS